MPKEQVVRMVGSTAPSPALSDGVTDQCGRRQGRMALSAEAFSPKLVASLMRDEKAPSQAAVLFDVRAIAMRAFLGVHCAEQRSGLHVAADGSQFAALFERVG